jgi:hypothetical protein
VRKNVTNLLQTIAIVIAVSLVFSGAARSQSWQPLTNQPGFRASTALLLTDGTVMVQDYGQSDWWRLTPDASGSYVNGSWSQLATLPAGYSPLDYSSAVLADGRVIVIGGEYNSFRIAYSNTGAIYDPVANSWTYLSPPYGWRVLPTLRMPSCPTENFYWPASAIHRSPGWIRRRWPGLL